MHVQLLELAGRTCVSSHAHGIGSKWSSVVSGLWGKWVITLTSKNALSNLPSQKPLAAISVLELSSVAMGGECLTRRGCRRGSMLMSWQTSVRRSAIRLRTSLC